MKLKQRIAAVVGITVVGFTLSVVLNLVSLQSSFPSGQKADNAGSNRELQSWDSENSLSAKEGPSDVANLVHALEGLVKSGPKQLLSNGRIHSGAIKQDDAASYNDIVRKLLQDQSFNTKETLDKFIGIGKKLEEYVDSTKVNPAPKEEKEEDEEEESDEDMDFFRRSGPKKNKEEDPQNVAVTDHKNDYPMFTLDKKIVPSLTKYVDSKLVDHKRKKAMVRNPISFKLHKDNESHLKSWQVWQNAINQYRIYDPEGRSTNNLLKDMNVLPIIGMSTMADYGTQIKVIFKLSDGSQTLFKPMRYKRDQERGADQYYFDDFERHHAEIGAFHLDRVMGYNRVPPNTGRMVNITNTIEKYASKSFKRTIYMSPAGNKCFYGKCDYYCDSGHSVCGTATTHDLIEGSVAAWLPFGKGTGKKGWENPWRRSYSKFRKADWETNARYCDALKHTPPYNSGRRLLDVLDITIFDYLMGNQDRHHYHTFKIFGNYTSPMLYDNGRAFGRIYDDEASILVPVVQCCEIRFSTLQKLLLYETAEDKLSDKVRRSIMRDPLSSGPNGPVLCEGHLKALDRRVSKVLDTVWKCVAKYGYNKVIIDDGI